MEDFEAQPTLKKFNSCTKEQLIKIAEHFTMAINKNLKKQIIRSELWSALYEKGVLPCDPSISMSSTAEKQVSAELLWLKELEIEMRRLEVKEKELNNDVELRRLEIEGQLCLKELELKHSSFSSASRSDDFDFTKCIRLVPPFNDQDADKYFVVFEHAAVILKWPKEVWPLLLQGVFTGKAQNVYASWSLELSMDYDELKAAVLRAYELVPEAYRQNFRNFKKTDQQTYVEFGGEKETLFDRWCRSLNVHDFDNLHQLVLLEEFKNCLPEKIVTYINEQQVSTVSDAAVLADKYILTHKHTFEKSHPSSERLVPAVKSFNFPVKSNSQGEVKLASKDSGDISDKPVCFYCKKCGHTINHCFALNKKERSSKTVNLMKTELLPPQQTLSIRTESSKPDLEMYAPFIMKGLVSLSEEESKVPVTILRDSAASQSVLLQGVLPLSEKSSADSSALVRGFGMQYVGVPLHHIFLDSDLVKGRVVVGVSPQFPIDGVSLILGNDLAGGKVLLNPEVTAVPLAKNPDDLEQKFPEVFSVCAVTHAMSKKQRGCIDDGVTEVELADSFMNDPGWFDPLCSSPGSPSSVATSAAPVVVSTSVEKSDPKEIMSRDNLIVEQKRDPSLMSSFDAVVPGNEVEKMSSCFLMRNNVLVRKWTPPHASGHDDWSVVKQIVVPQKYRHDILKVAHDNPLGGHLEVNKTYDRILRCFFWPGLKRDVRQYCKTCHICQVSGKPNQTIPQFPLYLIPVVGEPFEHVIVDCVGPFPRTKAGNKFLLTIMCSATRFPEAIPMRKITTPTVVKALVKFFSLFGLPKIIQTDQGSNFMSRIFAQVMKQLDIKHCCSSAYYPESQGAIERFHQTPKSMLRTHCLESNKDWDEGVHLLLFAAREMVQESLGFSPAELVFAHTVRGPLKLLQEKWLSDDRPKKFLTL